MLHGKSPTDTLARYVATLLGIASRAGLLGGASTAGLVLSAGVLVGLGTFGGGLCRRALFVERPQFRVWPVIPSIPRCFSRASDARLVPPHSCCRMRRIRNMPFCLRGQRANPAYCCSCNQSDILHLVKDMEWRRRIFPVSGVSPILRIHTLAGTYVVKTPCMIRGGRVSISRPEGNPTPDHGARLTPTRQQTSKDIQVDCGASVCILERAYMNRPADLESFGCWTRR